MKKVFLKHYESGMVSIENTIANFRCGEISSDELIACLVWGTNLIIAEKQLIEKMQEG